MRNACHDFWGSQELGRKLPGFLDPNCPAVVIPLHTCAFHPTQHAFLRHRWRSTRPGRLEQLESADPVLKLGSAEMMRTWVSWWGILLSGLLRKTMVDSGELHGCHFYINLCAYCCTWRTLPLFRELGALGQLWMCHSRGVTRGHAVTPYTQLSPAVKMDAKWGPLG